MDEIVLTPNSSITLNLMEQKIIAQWYEYMHNYDAVFEDEETKLYQEITANLARYCNE